MGVQNKSLKVSETLSTMAEITIVQQQWIIAATRASTIGKVYSVLRSFFGILGFFMDVFGVLGLYGKPY
jgi:hypothetical protein